MQWMSTTFTHAPHDTPLLTFEIRSIGLELTDKTVLLGRILSTLLLIELTIPCAIVSHVIDVEEQVISDETVESSTDAWPLKNSGNDNRNDNAVVHSLCRSPLSSQVPN